MSSAGSSLLGAAIGAFSLVASSATAAGEDASATDTVFLVDSSGSNFRSDPGGARKLLIEVFTTFAWDRPGDRVAIAQFAGWEETSRNEGNVVLPLSRIPENEQERARFIEELRAALEKMRPFGVGTDPNAALELVLPEVEKLRDAEEVAPEEVAAEGGGPAQNSLWAVMITDGDVNVVEGATARDIYIERAEKNHGAATPETLALVASEIFFNETLPRLKERGVTVTPVGLGRKAGEAGPFFERVKETIDVEVLYVDGPLLGRAFTSLLKSHPDRPPSEATDYGYSRATVEPGVEHRVPFRVLPETRRTRAVFFGSSGDYSVSVVPVQPGAAAPNDRTGGKGRFRVLDFTAAAPGEYEFIVKNTSEGLLEVEVTLYPDVALEVAVDDKDGVFTTPAGMPFKCAVSVLGGDGEVVKTAASLPELNVTLGVSAAGEPGEAPSAQEVAQEVTFGELPEAATTAEIAVGELGAGTRQLSARLRAFPVKGEDGEIESYIYEGPLRTFELKLVPAVAVKFGMPEAFAGQVVPLEGRFTVEVDLPPGEVTVLIEPEVTATLKWSADDEGGRYGGSVRFPEPGEWRIARTDTPELLVVPGEPGAVSVRERRMLVLRPGAPPDAGPEWEIESLDFTVRFLEAAGPYEVPVLLDVDIGPNEVPEFPASPFTASEKLAARGIETPSQDLLELKLAHAAEPQPGERRAGKRRIQAKVVLNVTTDEWLPREPGSVELVAKLGGDVPLDMALTARPLKVSLTFSDFWQKLVLLYWYIWGPALLVLLIVLWWLLLARFKGQELYLVSRLDQSTEPFHLLRDLCEGSKRQAYGTPEVENVAQFRMRGTKLFGGRVTVRALREGAMVAANNVQASNWVRLRHGDEVIAENPEGAYCRYWYFDHPPTEEELAGMLAADAVELGPDEFVIEGL